MTFDEYIKNPMGKNNSVFSNMEMYRSMYSDKLNKILLREAGKISYSLYINKDTYLIHMKIPSEVVPKFYYDAVVEFSTKNPITKMEKNIKKYDVRFFSNDPSFCFTFAHSFKKNNLFIDLLKPKMSKLALTKLAKERNPHDTVGYVKSLFFIYLIMNSRGLFEKSVFNVYTSPFSEKIFLDSIQHTDIKIADRQEAGERLRKEKQASKVVERRPVSDNVIQKQPIKQHAVTKTKTSNVANRTKTVKKK